MKNPSNDASAAEFRYIRQMPDIRSDDVTPRRLKILLAVALSSIVVGGAIDLLMDQPQNWLSLHVVIETLMLCGALLMATTLWLGWWRAQQSLQRAETRLEANLVDRDTWKASTEKVLAGLACSINAQFNRWELTASEREVALLLLKGCSHKHVAKVTGRSERTARQHAVAVYHKAGVGSRSELAAYFLEDLLLPQSGDAARFGSDSVRDAAH